MGPFFQKLRLLIRHRSKEREIRDELQFHLEEEADERQADGLTGDEARLAARHHLGNTTLIHEDVRAVWTWTLFEQLAQDCRYGLRMLVTNKTFSLLAILSLALGIGANTAIYSFMDSLLLRSLPVWDPESTVVLNWRSKPSQRDFVMRGMSGSTWGDETSKMAGIFPFPAFDTIRTNSGTVFSSVFAYYPTRKVNLMVKGVAEQASGEFVSGEYFHGLGVSPAAGRVIIPDDDRVGAPAVTVLSFAYSQSRFGDAASAPGQSILINGIPIAVVGVAPPDFFGVDPAARPDFYVPLCASLLLRLEGGANEANHYLDPNYYWLEMMARLRPGVSLSQAHATLSAVPPMGGDDGGQRSRARESSGAGTPGGSRRPRYVAATIFETLVCPAGHGVINPCDRVRQHCEPAAHESHGAQARNGGSAQYWSRSIPCDPPTADRKPATRLCRRRRRSPFRDLGNSISAQTTIPQPARSHQRKFSTMRADPS